MLHTISRIGRRIAAWIGSRSGAEPPPTSATSGDIDRNGDVVDERPEIGVYLLARLRMLIVDALFEQAERGAS